MTDDNKPVYEIGDARLPATRAGYFVILPAPEKNSLPWAGEQAVISNPAIDLMKFAFNI